MLPCKESHQSRSSPWSSYHFLLSVISFFRGALLRQKVDVLTTDGLLCSSVFGTGWKDDLCEWGESVTSTSTSSSSPQAPVEAPVPADPAVRLPGSLRGSFGTPDMLEGLALPLEGSGRVAKCAWLDDSSEERLDNGLGSCSFGLFLGGRPRFFGGSSLPGCNIERHTMKVNYAHNIT